MNQRADDDLPALLVDIEQPPEHKWFAFTLRMQRDIEQGDPLDIIAAALECCLDTKPPTDCEDALPPLAKSYELKEDEWLEAAEEE